MKRLIKILSVLFLGILLVLGRLHMAEAKGGTAKFQNAHMIDFKNAEPGDKSFTDTYGNEYNFNKVWFNSWANGYASYDFNGQYNTFQGTLVCSDEADSGGTMNFAIYGDGKLLYEKTNITRQTPGEDFSLDVSGVGTLTIKTTGDTYNGLLYIVNGILTKAEKPAGFPDTASLNNLPLIDSNNLEQGNDLFADNFGKLRSRYQSWDILEEAFALYNLDQKYQTFEGTLLAGHDTETDVVMGCYIYLDDELAFAQENITCQSEAVPVSLDVSGKKVMKVVAKDMTGSQHWHCAVVLSDDILTSHTHALGEWEVEREASCSETGSKVQHCTECGKTFNSQEIPATGHVLEEWTISKEATCAASGKEVRKCKDCGRVIEERETEVKEHEPEDEWIITQEPTCVVSGKEVRYCKECGEIADEREIEKKEHEPKDEWSVLYEPTCTEPGKEVKVCIYCDEILEEQEIEAKGHTPGEMVEIKPPTCTEAGAEAAYCKYCGKLIQNKSIPAKGHSFGEWETISGSILRPPVIKERECTDCFETEREESYLGVWLIILFVLLVLGIIAAGIVFYVLSHRKADADRAYYGEEYWPDSPKKKQNSRRIEGDDDILNRY